MLKSELTDEQWEAQCLDHYLTPYKQNYVPFSLDYVKEYRLVMPKRTFIPQCCFFCFELNNEPESQLVNQGIRSERWPDDHPVSQLYYCSKEKCKISAEISEQVYLADRRIALFNPKCEMIKGQITVKRSSGALEPDWKMCHYQYHLEGQLSIYVTRQDGTIKGCVLSDFLESQANRELIKKYGLKDITPYFDPWYPPSRKDDIMKLFNQYVAKADIV
jgi:hypothetical protein